MTTPSQAGEWALVLGASSGMGAATAKALARAGFHIVGVHLDRRGTQPQVDAVVQAVRACGVEAHFFNVNAADEEKRALVVADTAALLRSHDAMGKLRVLVHSLAFGAIRPFIGEADARVNASHLDMTLQVMANTLVYWTQDIVAGGLMGPGGRIFALTSAGAHRVWPGYGAVSGAKAALEAYTRQLAVELAPQGITANAIQAGVTETPALQKIPGFEQMMEHAAAGNPSGRLTTPDDVACAIVALVHPGTAWMTGNVIRVDGGEDIVA